MLLAGVRANGTAVVIKLLFTGLDDTRKLEFREGEIEHEIECCSKLALADRDIALVPSEVVMLDVPQEFVRQTCRRGRFHALLMPRYLDSVARGPTFPRMVIAREARRLVDALQYMHRVAGLVHMDVKGDNVFFDNSGAWFLGDFGSACMIGGRIRSSTYTFYHGAMDDVAHPRYDWFMLLVLLLIEMGEKDKWSQRFMNSDQGRRVSYDKVMREADRAMIDESYPPELQSVIRDIMDMYQSS
jgi:serine/threonine protein kinase